MTDEIKHTDGLLAQIMKEGNIEAYTKKPMTIERFNEILRLEEERRKNHVQTYPMAYLMVMDDDMFKQYWNCGDNIMFLGGIDMLNKIEERAKKLGLKIK